MKKVTEKMGYFYSLIGFLAGLMSILSLFDAAISVSQILGFSVSLFQTYTALITSFFNDYYQLLISLFSAVLGAIVARAMFAYRKFISNTQDLLYFVGRSLSGGQATPQSESKNYHPNGIQLIAITIKNIRCFEDVTIKFTDESGSRLQSIVLGDNASGKSTFLRCIALGLCPESDAVSLLKQEAGNWIRTGEESGSITTFVEGDGFSGTIVTEVLKDSSDQEFVRQNTTPSRFPWADLFVAAYGTARSQSIPSSPRKYSTAEAVASLFQKNPELLNPEVVLNRAGPEDRQKINDLFKQILMLGENNGDLIKLDDGVVFSGPWGEQLLDTVSDGYRSTAQWLFDLIGRQFLKRERWQSSGILIIDELEQHLHPRWQRHIVGKITNLFPNLHLICSTHTPLVAGGAADLENGQMIMMKSAEDGCIEAAQAASDLLKGLGADEILTSIFGLYTTQSVESWRDVERYNWLIQNGGESQHGSEIEKLRTRIREKWPLTGSNLAAEIADAVSAEFERKRTQRFGDKEVVDALIREHVSSLFKLDEGSKRD